MPARARPCTAERVTDHNPEFRAGFEAVAERRLPPAERRLPRREEGTRPARPLPYRPDADGTYDPAAGRFRLALRNTGAAGAHLALYPYAAEYATPQHRDVRGTADRDVPVRDGAYDSALTGPNGFRREYAGTAAGAAAGSSVRTHLDVRERNVRSRTPQRATTAGTS